MFYYASLNQDNIVNGIQQSGNPIEPLPSHYLSIDSYDNTLIGKHWNGTTFEDGPEPEPIYKTLKRVGFIRLIQASGGTTQQQVLDAKGDPALAYFWLMFDMATEFERSDPEIDAGLDALVALGYLPSGKQVVLNAWPSTDLVS